MTIQLNWKTPTKIVRWHNWAEQAVKKIVIFPDGVTEKQIRPAWWTPWANTLLYLPLESDVVDRSWNSVSTSSSNVSFTTTWGVVSANIPRNWYITIPDTYITTSLTEKTISMWLYVWATQTTYRRWIVWLLKEGYSWNSIAFIENTTKISSYLQWVSIWIDTPVNIYPANQWFNCIITTKDGTNNNKIYINWQQVVQWNGTSTAWGNMASSVNNRVVLFWTDGSSEWLDGSAREAIFESKARTVQEISDYYNLTKWNYWL